MKQMKQSGVEWLGEIPNDWAVLYPKALFNIRNECMREDDEQLTASQERGIISQKDFQKLEGRRIVQVILNREILKHVEPGDFVMHMRSFQGGLELSRKIGCVSSAYVMLVPRNEKVRHEYFRYLFKSSAYINALRSTSERIRDGQALRFYNFAQVFLPLPPVDVQDNISVYLDKRCAVLDEEVSKRLKIIEKLKEYKKAIIANAVTKGLDPNVPLSNKGIKWTSKTPADWRTYKFKHLFEIKKRIAGKDGLTVLSITQKGIVPKDFSSWKGQFAESYSDY